MYRYGQDKVEYVFFFLSKFNERKLSLNQEFIISKTVWVFALNLVVFEWVMIILVSSTYEIAIDLLFANADKSFIYRRTAGDPGCNAVGHHVWSLPSYRGCFHDVSCYIL